VIINLPPFIWGTGLAIAATTGYLSIAADRHYLTDVITAAAVGSAFGFGIRTSFIVRIKRMPRTYPYRPPP